MKALIATAAAFALLGSAASAQIYSQYRFADPMDYEALVSLRDFRARIIGYAETGRCPYAKQLARELNDNNINTRLRELCDGPTIRLWD